MSWPFLRYGLQIPFQRRSFLLILSGYAAYFVAAASSATRYMGDWYVHAGGVVLQAFDTAGHASWTRMEENVSGREAPLDRMEFWLMDYLYEESIELIGAGCLLAGFLSLAAAQSKRSRCMPTPPSGMATTA